MIHSMSGGLLDEYGTYTLVKVVFEDDAEKRPFWYATDFEVEEGDHVSAPRGAGDLPKTAVVVKVENGVSGQVSPVPIKRVKKLYKKL